MCKCPWLLLGTFSPFAMPNKLRHYVLIVTGLSTWCCSGDGCWQEIFAFNPVVIDKPVTDAPVIDKPVTPLSFSKCSLASLAVRPERFAGSKTALLNLLATDPGQCAGMGAV